MVLKKLEIMDDQIEELRERSSALAGKSRLEMELALHEVQQKASEARRKITQLQTAGELASTELRAEVNTVLRDLERAFERVTALMPRSSQSDLALDSEAGETDRVRRG